MFDLRRLCTFRQFFCLLQLMAVLHCSTAFALEGAEVHTGREITVLEMLYPGGLAVGQELRVGWLDSGEVLDVVVMTLRKFGANIEIEAMNREDNSRILFEIPADGISELQ